MFYSGICDFSRKSLPPRSMLVPEKRSVRLVDIFSQSSLKKGRFHVLTIMSARLLAFISPETYLLPSISCAVRVFNGWRAIQRQCPCGQTSRRTARPAQSIPWSRRFDPLFGREKKLFLPASLLIPSYSRELKFGLLSRSQTPRKRTVSLFLSHCSMRAPPPSKFRIMSVSEV